MRRHPGLALTIWVMAMVVPLAAAADPFAAIEARIDVASHTIAPGKPVMLEFTLRNTSDDPVVLAVPEVATERSSVAGGLPLAHVFSGSGFTGLTVRGGYQRTWTDAFGYQPPASVPELVLAPHAIVGVVVDVSAYYPPLRSPGTYRIVWQPYGGLVTSNQLTLDVAPLKQVDILTDHGTMRMAFQYDLAPKHIAHLENLCRNHNIGVYIDKTDSLASLFITIDELGGILDRPAEAKRLTKMIRNRLETIRRASENRPRPKVLLTLRSPDRLGSMTTVAGDSFLSSVIELAGGKNIFGEMDIPYPQVSLEEILARQPDVIIEAMPGEKIDASRRKTLLAQWESLGPLPAVQNHRIHFLTDDYVLIPSPRVVLLAAKIQSLLVEEADAGAK